MNEQYKIGEARFFLERMEESLGDRVSFRYYLSAFLSAAQSVRQYPYTEAKGQSNLKWYEDHVGQINNARNNIMKNFKENRDMNIHWEPVDPASHITIATSENVAVFDALSVVLFNDKPVETMKPIEEVPPPKPSEGRNETPKSKTEATVRYHFIDWFSSEDLISLSHRYIEVLEHFVRDGIVKRILTE
jgi:hypothetical protein